MIDFLIERDGINLIIGINQRLSSNESLERFKKEYKENLEIAEKQKMKLTAVFDLRNVSMFMFYEIGMPLRSFFLNEIRPLSERVLSQSTIVIQNSLLVAAVQGIVSAVSGPVKILISTEYPPNIKILDLGDTQPISNNYFTQNMANTNLPSGNYFTQSMTTTESPSGNYFTQSMTTTESPSGNYFAQSMTTTESKNNFILKNMSKDNNIISGNSSTNSSIFSVTSNITSGISETKSVETNKSSIFTKSIVTKNNNSTKKSNENVNQILPRIVSKQTPSIAKKIINNQDIVLI